jgi:hypothetical protein
VRDCEHARIYVRREVLDLPHPVPEPVLPADLRDNAINLLWSGTGGGSYQQLGESPRGNDPCSFVPVEGQEAALVPRYEVIRFAAFGPGQQKIIRGIGRPFHPRQPIDSLGELLDLLDKAGRLGST